MTASRTKNESFDYIMRSPHYLFSKSQLNHLFVENEYFAEMWHNENFLTIPENVEHTATWRLKGDRMKTGGVALVVCLNIGTDPPDAIKPAVCARRECWFDPTTTSRKNGLEIIGNTLQQQYESWQSRAKYKQCLDPLAEDLRRTCINLRKSIKGDRLLLHYNGHGVPRPTINGELWVFGKHYTHYMPVSVAELKSWCEDPSIYVLDCSGAGVLIPHFLDNRQRNSSDGNVPPQNNANEDTEFTEIKKNTSKNSLADSAMDALNNIIILASCKDDETLPTNPQYPADIFTACLTTPIPIAIRWFILQNSHIAREVSLDISENIPGQIGDRKTLRGEINWIFTAITDSIAWSILPTEMFQKLLRQDLLVAALFRNFLLAQRVMKSLNCTPISVPAISDTSSHPLWQSWDLAVEKCLLAIIAMKKSGVPVAGNPDISLNIPNPMSSSVMPSPVGLHRAQTTGAPQMNPSASSGATSGSLSTSFFTENLNAFELWLDFGGQSGLNDKTPIYLPILLQVLLSQSHRQKALHLLSRYLSLGPEAANNALLVGVFPYILKLLNNPSSETQQILMAIWTYVLGFDNRCRQELVKDNFVHIFIHNLKIDSMSHKQKTMVAFILCEICHNYRPGQKACLDLKMHVICSSLLGAPFTQPHAHLKKWLLFAIAKLCEDFNLAKFQCIAENIHMRLYQYRYDSHPAVRIAAVVALGELFGASLVFNSVPTTPTTPGNKNGSNSPNSRLAEQCKIRNIELEIAMNILEGCMDGCVAVRREAVIALSKMLLLGLHKDCIKMVATTVMMKAIELSAPPPLPIPSAVLSAGKATNSPKPTGKKGKSFYDPVLDPAPAPIEVIWMLDPPTLSALVQKLSLLIEDQQAGKVHLRKFGESLISDDTNSNPPNIVENEVAKHLASAYVKLWLALQELKVKDPHPQVVKTVQAVSKHVKFEVSNDLHVAQFGESIVAQSGEEYGNVSPNKKSQSSRNLKVDESVGPPPQLSIVIPKEGNDSSNKNRMTNMGPPTGTGVGTSGGLVLGRLDGNENISATNADGQVAMASDINLVSSSFECNRKVFLLPETGYNVVDDLLSTQGRDKAIREKLRHDIMALDNRICDSFKPIQDFGLSGLFDKDDSPYMPPQERQSEISSSSRIGNTSTGVDISMLPTNLTKFESKAKITMEYSSKSTMSMFHAFHDVIAVSDGLGVGVWSLDSGAQLVQIRNQNTSNIANDLTSAGTSAYGAKLSSLSYSSKSSRITSMTWINESLDSLLMTGCDDGTVVIYKDVGTSIDENVQKNNENSSEAPLNSKFAGIVRPSAFSALPNVNTVKGSGTILSWQQSTGTLAVAGNSVCIRIWDITREQCVREFQTGVDTCATALVTTCNLGRLSSNQSESFLRRSQSGNSVNDDVSTYAWAFAGFADGSIGVFDQRVQSSGGKVLSAREHNSWIISAHMRYDIPEVITGSLSGEVKFWDIRTMRSYKNFEVHKSSLTAIAVHNCAPIMATGSSAKFIKLVTFGGDQLGMIRYHEGFMGQRIGPVSCLAFHPVRLMMAAGSDDNLVSIYSIPDG